MSRRAATKTDSGLAARLAAIASLGAAVIHLAVVPTHWSEWIPSGLFFISIAAFQLIWAGVVLARTTPPVLVAGILGNVGAAALWVLSRTAGAPFGPHAGDPEFVQAAGLCALLLEVYVVMGAGWVWYRGHHPEPISAVANAFVLLGLGAVVASATTLGVASGLQHDHHGPAGAEAEHHTLPAGGGDGHHDHQDSAPPPITGSTHQPKAPAPGQAPPKAVDPPHDPAPHDTAPHDHHDE